MPDVFPAPNIVGFTSFSLSVFVCFTALCMSSFRSNVELEQSLLSNNEDCASAIDNFSRAGLWSRLTFRWMNPVFDKGRAERLELSHVPRIPQSETAESSSSLLQESLRKQKQGQASLPRAIISTVWRSLALNAIFAGKSITSLALAFSLFFQMRNNLMV